MTPIRYILNIDISFYKEWGSLQCTNRWKSFYKHLNRVQPNTFIYSLQLNKARQHIHNAKQTLLRFSRPFSWVCNYAYNKIYSWCTMHTLSSMDMSICDYHTYICTTTEWIVQLFTYLNCVDPLSFFSDIDLNLLLVNIQRSKVGASAMPLRTSD